jgi:hypothetical protein
VGIAGNGAAAPAGKARLEAWFGGRRNGVGGRNAGYAGGHRKEVAKDAGLLEAMGQNEAAIRAALDGAHREARLE